MLETGNRSPRRGGSWRVCYTGCCRGKPGGLRAGHFGLRLWAAGKGPGVGRDPHSCLEGAWKLSEKCLVLDSRFCRRMSVSGTCQEVVWKASGVRDEKSKPTTGWPLPGLLHWVVQGGSPARWWRAFGLGRAIADKGSGVARDTHSCLGVVWKLSGKCLAFDRSVCLGCVRKLSGTCLVLETRNLKRWWGDRWVVHCVW